MQNCLPCMNQAEIFVKGYDTQDCINRNTFYYEMNEINRLNRSLKNEN